VTDRGRVGGCGVCDRQRVGQMVRSLVRGPGGTILINDRTRGGLRKRKQIEVKPRF
jgi:hypothetical protein